ncbi:MAG: pyridoxamine 5'-phosphate oxidase family protein [Salinirussus sp.]
MTEISGAWSRAEAARFLDAAVVPMRLACHRPDGAIWPLSLWYRYRDPTGGEHASNAGEDGFGTFECATGAGADVVAFLERDGHVGFEVSTNAPPYMGIRGSGTATVSPDRDKAVIEALVRRYLGGTESGMARRLLADDRQEVRIAVEPDRLYTWDFTARMREMTDVPAAECEPPSPRE